MKENIVAFLITEIYVSYCLHFNSPGIRRGCSDCKQRPRHSAEDFSLKEAKSQYFQDF